MAIAKGDLIGPYEILSHIGAGGMGDVWRARDQRIRRDVAVKILPDAYGEGDERVERFEQEARAAGALNHPGLVTIFDVGTKDSAPYIVMELLEGQTLRDVIGRVTPGPTPHRRVIDYASQIAAALAVAHEKGIVHRDLKPENLFLTSDGRVKILDFGLAKLAEGAGSDSGRHKTARHLTSAGMVVGTPGYMSPEQVRAQPLDHRTDIFALGTVMYEMLCGRSPFESESAVETMHAVLNTEPPMLLALAPDVPPALETIVRHCMEKNPRDRFQSARDLAFQLRMLVDGEARTTATRRPSLSLHRKRDQRYRWIAAALLAIGAAVAGGFALSRVVGAEAESAPRTFRQLTFGDGLELFPTLAPDSKSFAYVSAASGDRDIYVQRVDGRTAINITGDSPDDDSEPAFSPDGSQIAFRSEREGGGIFVMGVTGESVRRLTDRGFNPSWSPDGTRIVYATAGVELRPHTRAETSELWIVDTRTGVRKPLVQPRTGGPDFGRESDGVQPSWSPHGKRIAFWGLANWTGQRDIWTIDPQAPQPKRTVVRVTTGSALHWNPVWSPDGKYLYYGSDRDGTLNLWRVAIDEGSGRPLGSPEAVALPASVSGNFAFSQNGDMAFVTITRTYRLIELPFDATTGQTGTPQTLFGGSEEILTFQPSPDGKTIAYTTGGGIQEDLFVADLNGTRVRQLTNDAAKDRSVSWSPDGKTLYFYSNRDGAYNNWSIAADGSGLKRVADKTELRRLGINNLYIPNISPDGKTIATQSEKSNVLVHLDRPDGRRVEPIPLNVTAPRWSPDGTKIIGSFDTQTLAGPRAGILVYSIPGRRTEKVYETGVRPQFLPGGRKIVFFEKNTIGQLDLDMRRVTSTPFVPIQGTRVDVTNAIPSLSHDGTTLFLRHIHEQGDVWILGAPQK